MVLDVNKLDLSALTKKEKIDIKEALILKDKKLPLFVLMSILLLVPFAFAIDSFLSLKDCESKPSNGCPSLYSSDGNHELSANLSTGTIDRNSK